MRDPETWAAQDWSYEVEKEREEKPCTPLTPIVLVRCCRVWPIVPGYPVRRCGICGRVPAESVEVDDDNDL